MKTIFVQDYYICLYLPPLVCSEDVAGSGDKSIFDIIFEKYADLIAEKQKKQEEEAARPKSIDEKTRDILTGD